MIVSHKLFLVFVHLPVFYFFLLLHLSCHCSITVHFLPSIVFPDMLFFYKYFFPCTYSSQSFFALKKSIKTGWCFLTDNCDFSIVPELSLPFCFKLHVHVYLTELFDIEYLWNLTPVKLTLKLLLR